MKLAGSFALVLTMFLVGCGKPDLGEECDTVGGADQCSGVLVCSDSASGKPTCQTVCFTGATCGTNEDCLPVSGSETGAAVLSCRPR